MIEHLIVSSVVLALAILAAQLLPLTARTRHALLLAGLAKFFIPAAAFTWFGIETIKVIPIGNRVFDGRTGAMPVEAAPINWWLLAWAAIATLIFARWLLMRTRTITAALRSPAAPSHRELEVLDEARRLLGMRTAVDLLRSPVCEAPAVLRVVRPVIILPARGCDDLTDDELRALLLHELAHVARRDNLIALFVALTAALLWFHPLIWLALRRIDAAREQACDEVAIEHAETYVDALAKVCRALVAPHTAGAVCMAGANIKERINHLMRFEVLKSRAWSHRGVVAASLIAILAATALAATPPSTSAQLYSLQFDVFPNSDRVAFDLRVVDNASGNVVAKGRVTAMHGQWATLNGTHNGRNVDVRARMREGEPAQLFLFVGTPTEKLQRTLYTWDNSTTVMDAPPEPQYSGAPISISLKDAKLADVMKTFGQITGLEFQIAPGVEGLVTIDVKDMPWDQALDVIAKQNGLRLVIKGKTVHVAK